MHAGKEVALISFPIRTLEPGVMLQSIALHRIESDVPVMGCLWVGNKSYGSWFIGPKEPHTLDLPLLVREGTIVRFHCVGVGANSVRGVGEPDDRALTEPREIGPLTEPKERGQEHSLVEAFSDSSHHAAQLLHGSHRRLLQLHGIRTLKPFHGSLRLGYESPIDVAPSIGWTRFDPPLNIRNRCVILRNLDSRREDPVGENAVLFDYTFSPINRSQ